MKITVKKYCWLVFLLMQVSIAGAMAQTAAQIQAKKDSLHQDSIKKGLVKVVAGKQDAAGKITTSILAAGGSIVTTITTTTNGGYVAPIADAKAEAAAAAAKNNQAIAAKCQVANLGMLSGIGWATIGLIIVIFLWIAMDSDLLKAQIIDPIQFMQVANKTSKYATETDINKISKPYSLARSQLGLWTVVIGCSYIYVELCKYFPVPSIKLDGTLLGLMGISAGTAAAGNLIDNNANPEQQGVMGPSGGFFKDILSDQNGINIHRFQNVVWTVIAIILYLCQIPDVPCGQLPTLDTTLVALTGISSATYLGLKINENKPPAILPTQSANTASGAGTPSGGVIQ